MVGDIRCGAIVDPLSADRRARIAPKNTVEFYDLSALFRLVSAGVFCDDFIQGGGRSQLADGGVSVHFCVSVDGHT